MPKVSICIPSYKNIEFLKRAIDSVFIQEFEDFEVIITDDTPDDEVYIFIKEYQHFHKIKYHKNKTPLGSPANWNEAIKKASGLYLKVLHHDDWFFDKNSLKNFVDTLDSNPDASIGILSSVNVDIKKKEKRVIEPDKDWCMQLNSNPYNLLYGNAFGGPSSIIFRNYPEYIYFDSNLKWFVDVEAYSNLIRTKGTAVINDFVGVNIGINDGQATNDYENDENVIIFELFYCLRKWNIDHVFKFPLLRKKIEYELSRFEIIKKDKIQTIAKEVDLPKDIWRTLFIVNLRVLFKRTKKIFKDLFKLSNKKRVL